MIAVALLAGLTAAGTFTDELWRTNEDVYREILKHPFLTQLQDGSLDRKAFAFYLIQDAFYLGEFARALEATAAKAPRKEWAELLKKHARESVQEETRLHESVLAQYGVSADERARTEPSPDAVAYTNYLVRTAHTDTFSESMAALLPCYWIYWEVGKELSKRRSKDPTYQKWIDAYSTPAYGETVRTVLSIVDEVAGRASADERRRMGERFRRSSRYEWMFWDSAYARRGWQP